jgi:hypothetical protein
MSACLIGVALVSLSVSGWHDFSPRVDLRGNTAGHKDLDKWTAGVTIRGISSSGGKKSAPVTVINAAREGGGETSDVDVPTSLPLLIGARGGRL